MGITFNQLIVLLITGLLAGMFSGMFGLGGGLIVIPSLVIILGMTQHQAQGTNLAFMLAPIGLFAAMNYYKQGHVNVKYAIILAITFFIGAYLGSLWSVNIPSHILKKAFGVAVILIGIKMIFGK